jgi:hypothetical protein
MKENFVIKRNRKGLLKLKEESKQKILEKVPLFPKFLWLEGWLQLESFADVLFKEGKINTFFISSSIIHIRKRKREPSFLVVRKKLK